MKKRLILFVAILFLAGFISAQIPTILPTSQVTETLELLKGARITANQYLNFGPLYGTSGYGIKDNSGTLQYKNSGGAWANLTSGTTTFLGLTDTPGAYTGAGSYLVRVNASETALEFVGLSPTINATGFSLAGGTTSKTLTVELDSLVNQDLTTDASPTHVGLTLGSIAANGILNLYGLHANGYYSIIKGSNAEGLTGADTRIGLDPTNRTLVLCNRGDIDTDFGFFAADQPTIALTQSGYTVKYFITGITAPTLEYVITAPSGVLFNAATVRAYPNSARTSGNFVTFDSYGVGYGLIDTDGRQAQIYVEPRVEQSGTAAFDGLYINPTLTSVGSGATGDGNNLLNLSVSSAPKFLVDAAGLARGRVMENIDSDTDEVDTTVVGNTHGGLLIVFCSTDSATGTFRLEGGTIAVVSANALYSTTKDNASTYNVYFETNVIKVQNKVGDNKVLYAAFYGAGI